jgi:hypothetical protein
MCRIEIVRPSGHKPYLGGLKDIKSNLLYHHAFAQTDQKIREHKTKYHREVTVNHTILPIVTNI